MLGVVIIFLRAYSLGGGTYTGIEAVSNGMQIMREPKVESGKRSEANGAAEYGARVRIRMFPGWRSQ